MPKLNLDTMSREQLASLAADIDAALKALADRRRRAAFAEVRAVLKRYRVSLDDVLGGRSPASKPGKPARYRHPENPAVTWSGHGRRPGWFRDAVERGVAPEALAV